MELKPGTVICSPGAQLWIVGKWLAVDGKNAWEFQGVFSTEEKAIHACRTEMYFVGPAELNKSLPHERMPRWLGSYYPKLEKQKKDE